MSLAPTVYRDRIRGLAKLPPERIQLSPKNFRRHGSRQLEVIRGLLAEIGVAGALLPILHQVQARLGFIPTTAVPQIARALNLSTAQVHGVLSFYHFFRTEPLASKHHIQLCVAEACQARGALNLKTQCDHLAKSLGEEKLSVEPIY